MAASPLSPFAGLSLDLQRVPFSAAGSYLALVTSPKDAQPHRVVLR
jgi:hypothetical protein